MRGVFTFWAGTPKEVRIPNIVVDEGEESFLKILLQGDDTIAPIGNNFYVGLCNQVIAETDTLADISSEPTETNGYARAAVERSAVGFSTIDQVNGVFRAKSKLLGFAASGGNFSAAFTRAFFCNVSTGASGKLFAASGALAAPVSLTDGQTFPFQYEFYLD